MCSTVADEINQFLCSGKIDDHSEEDEVNQKDDTTARGAGNYSRAQCFRKGMAIQRSMLQRLVRVRNAHC